VDLLKKHATGCTIALFLLAVLALSLLPLPTWLRPIDALRQDDPFNTLLTTLFRRPDSVPRKSDSAGGDWALQEDPEPDDDAPRPELEIKPPPPAPLAIELSPWTKPSRPKLEQYRKRLLLAVDPIANFCVEPRETSARPQRCTRTALDRFFHKLTAAYAKENDAIARVVHYGDSIIASDHITDVVRQRLQERFGSAGKGFLLITRYNDRQRRLRTGSGTKGWHVEHIAGGKLPDRFFGYAGASFTAERPGEESAFSDVGPSRYADVYYLAHKDGGVLEVLADDKSVATLETKAEDARPEARFFEVTLPEGTKMMKLRAKQKGVRLFGVSLEAHVPGVIYESIGIPGSTSEVWTYPDADGFAKQLSHREPALIVTMLGGNDARALHQKKKTMEEIERSTRAFVARLHTSAPNADCLIISPLDAVEAKASGEMRSRPEVPEMISMQRKVAAEMGCGFWDMYRSMGAAGSLERWFKAGLINPDLIHPKGGGADLLGELMAEALMDAYDARMIHDGDGQVAKETPGGD
jgi:lysophospholipase L1-like esterase